MPLGDAPRAVQLDVPDWTLPHLEQSLGADLPAICRALRRRAPVHLRARLDRDAVSQTLSSEGFDAQPHPLSATAIEVAGQPRGLMNLQAFKSGDFEFQDAGSQALVDHLPVPVGARVLDLCAGGGGKALALAARLGAPVWAHDAIPGRLKDLPERAKRARADIRIIDRPESAAPFDVVLCDVPCSGSGAWRRQAEARWRLTPERLAELTGLQAEIMARAVRLTRPGGLIAYMTCSLLSVENDKQSSNAATVHSLERHFSWSCTPLDGADGFYLSVLKRHT